MVSTLTFLKKIRRDFIAKGKKKNNGGGGKINYLPPSIPLSIIVSAIIVSGTMLLVGNNLITAFNQQTELQSALESVLTSLRESSATPASQTTASSDDAIAGVAAEIIPTGVPRVYGVELGVSFDDTVKGLNTLAELERTLSFDALSETQKARYIEIATTQNTSCEYCCGMGSRGFGTEKGKVACWCAHNLAFSGLTKYLLKNHENEFTNEQIIEELQKWKALFFPKQTIAKEMRLRVNPSGKNQWDLTQLPNMVGGC